MLDKLMICIVHFTAGIDSTYFIHFFLLSIQPESVGLTDQRFNEPGLRYDGFFLSIFNQGLAVLCGVGSSLIGLDRVSLDMTIQKSESHAVRIFPRDMPFTGEALAKENGKVF